MLILTAFKLVYQYNSLKVLVAWVGKQFMWTLKGVSLSKDSKVNNHRLKIQYEFTFIGVMEIISWLRKSTILGPSAAVNKVLTSSILGCMIYKQFRVVVYVNVLLHQDTLVEPISSILLSGSLDVSQIWHPMQFVMSRQ